MRLTVVSLFVTTSCQIHRKHFQQRYFPSTGKEMDLSVEEPAVQVADLRQHLVPANGMDRLQNLRALAITFFTSK